MADLSVLTDRILNEAKDEAKSIIEAAELEAEKIKQEAEALSRKKYKALVDKGALEAQNLKERLISGARLKARDDILSAKQKIIQKTFEKALDEFRNLGKDEYISYIRENCTQKEGTEFIVSEKYIEDVRKEFPHNTVSDKRFVKSGFIEISDGIENNYTFETQIEYSKDELESEVAKILFK